MITATEIGGGGERMHIRSGQFRWPCRCAGAIRSASPDVAWPGLYQKPLDAAIRRLLAPYCPGGRQGDNHYEHVPTLMAILMPIAMRRCYTPRIAQWRRFVAFIKVTKRHHRTSTRSDSVNRSSQCCYFRDISSSSLKKSSSCPNNNRGVTFQSDRKDLVDGVEYLYRGAKLVS
jgi:hypothetical protein